MAETMHEKLLDLAENCLPLRTPLGPSGAPLWPSSVVWILNPGSSSDNPQDPWNCRWTLRIASGTLDRAQEPLDAAQKTPSPPAAARNAPRIPRTSPRGPQTVQSHRIVVGQPQKAPETPRRPEVPQRSKALLQTLDANRSPREALKPPATP
ncbi:uncharacterized protein PGTG_14566 [Puccinia graminis f. sp. tritici CRL 75-36-700-3]|uniref:Uncharacterized protein n=1 Tax=Puccinia graminis f. sp. tritici (strain CRL 75-36-700-3 / race SCCL) TaxID=418459 RepID=E3KU76_PUCGT|nr:uncharacterized protein PGTG_14566 [Puccinia graminis f. sp. tritici CRL 75-36-700-3]EFP87851.2 hypothetical protein PGTG_14566 [Puccinia graminis f. sp. tritici CRL 75-36-700-3]